MPSLFRHLDSLHAQTPSSWTTDLSASLYKIDGWGAPYFTINSLGNVSVRPFGPFTLPHQEIDVLKVVKRSSDLGLPSPLMVRFPDILKHRIESLNSAFESAIGADGYRAHYQGIYPVKCNQDRFVVEDVVRFGVPSRFGLEAGSKPELLLSMSCLVKGNPNAFLICNGYKDREYISLALAARRLNLNTVIVLEQEDELDLVIRSMARLKVRPVIGLRAKLRTRHSGHFGSTSGENGKFGLTASQILGIVRKLEARQMLDCLQLLHFHIGSQIPTTALLSDGVAEAAQIYCELVKLGASIKVIDIGGGLGIDYDGSHSGRSDMSVGYNLEEYASTVVKCIQTACDRKKISHPIICSESGRALVSHHSVLIFEAISSNTIEKPLPINPSHAYLLDELVDEARDEYQNLMGATLRGDRRSYAKHMEKLKQTCVDRFRDGSLSLQHLACVDALCDLIAKETGETDPVHTYDINLSIFKSMPDFWAIGQLFPVMPVHRLNERPTKPAVLSDLTCDSDGKIDRFIGDERTLPLHETNGGKYYLGMFLGGAYQESLGGAHNLFGAPSMVRVSAGGGDCGFRVTRAEHGATCAEVLRSMRHEPAVMFEGLKRRVEDSVEGGDGGEFVCDIARAFRSMTYLVGDRDEGDHDEVEGDEEWENAWGCLNV